MTFIDGIIIFTDALSWIANKIIIIAVGLIFALGLAGLMVYIWLYLDAMHWFFGIF
jgi:hypothetical protein